MDRCMLFVYHEDLHGLVSSSICQTKRPFEGWTGEDGLPSKPQPFRYSDGRFGFISGFRRFLSLSGNDDCTLGLAYIVVMQILLLCFIVHS